jgi:hypothetical protein
LAPGGGSEAVVTIPFSGPEPGIAPTCRWSPSMSPLFDDATADEAAHRQAGVHSLCLAASVAAAPDSAAQFWPWLCDGLRNLPR